MLLLTDVPALLSGARRGSPWPGFFVSPGNLEEGDGSQGKGVWPLTTTEGRQNQPLCPEKEDPPQLSARHGEQAVGREGASVFAGDIGRARHLSA